MEPYYYGVYHNAATGKWEVKSYTKSRSQVFNLIAECPSLIIAQRIALALDKEG